MNASHSAVDAPATLAGGPIRVMICDDSAVIRGLMARSLEADPDIHVVATVSNGEMAVNSLPRYDVEVLILDIEMPIMDGLTALPKLMALRPDLKVIMASTLTRRGADISLRAMAAGASDYLGKPTTTMALNAAADFKAELAQKVKALGAARRRQLPLSQAGVTRQPVAGAVVRAPTPDPVASAPRPAPGHPAVSAFGSPRGPITLRALQREIPEIVAIGSSTGGPQALFTVLGGLRPGISQPIVITQHMPATFTTILAEHIERSSGIPTFEAQDGMRIEGGKIYVAPGDFHMIVEQSGSDRVVRLLKTPPENFCRPSVDPMLRSLVKIYGRRILTVILTGMGQDGLRGSEAAVAAGGSVVAQDEASSVVWGMPGAVALAGVCCAIIPLPEIAPWVRKVVTRGFP